MADILELIGEQYGLAGRHILAGEENFAKANLALAYYLVQGQGYKRFSPTYERNLDQFVSEELKSLKRQLRSKLKK